MGGVKDGWWSTGLTVLSPFCGRARNGQVNFVADLVTKNA